MTYDLFGVGAVARVVERFSMLRDRFSTSWMLLGAQKHRDRVRSLKRGDAAYRDATTITALAEYDRDWRVTVE